MQRKMVNVYLYNDANRLKLRLIEIYPLAYSTITKPESENEIFEKKSLLIGWMLQGLVNFNDFDNINDPEASDLVRICYFRNMPQFEIVKDPSYYNTSYAYSDVIWELAYDSEELLMQQLGALDYGIHSIQATAPDNGFEFNLFYCDKIPDFKNKVSIIYDTRLKSKNYIAPEKSLSRYTVEWLINDLNKDPFDYKSTIKLLNHFLETKDFSLTRVIREKLYPDPNIVEVVEDICFDEPLSIMLLNPTIPFVQATENFLKEVSLKLNSTPFELTPEVNNKDYSAWSWANTVSSVVGKTAHDKGKYHGGYTEVQLLQQGKLRYVKENDTFALSFLKTNAYNDYYAPGSKNYAILAEELEAIAKHMRLTLFPNQDFHQGEMLFKSKPALFVFFKSLTEKQNKFWQSMIRSLYGKPAPDRGTYHKNYTEVLLLEQSTIRYTNKGMILEFLHTDAYATYYAKDKVNYAILEIELRAACGLMGLIFLPNQDFHQGKVYFSKASEIFLKDRGFHISENYCKAKMHVVNKSRFFKAQNEENLFHLLPNDMQVNIMEMIEPELPRSEIEAMLRR